MSKKTHGIDRLSLLSCGVGLSALIAVMPGHAAAQDAAPSAPAAAQASESDEVIVTGTRIRGVAPVGSPIIGLGRQDIADSGAVSVGDLLKDIPSVSALGSDIAHRGSQGGPNNLAYGSAVNLHALGPSATLLLLNGRRLPRAQLGGFVDNSNIPGVALSRIEVVADGASAIYGSDAIGGVVNLIMRDRFEGLETNFRYGVADGYDDRQESFIFGGGSDRSNAWVAVEHSFTSRLRGADRDFFRANQTASGGRDFRNTTCDPGTITVAGNTYALPNLDPGTVNRCDNIYQLNDILPEIERTSVAGSVSYDLTDNIELYSRGFYTSRNFDLQFPIGTTIGGLPVTTLTVPSTNAFYIDPSGTGATSQTINVFLGNLLNDYNSTIGDEVTWAASFGARVALPHDWSADFAVAVGRERMYGEYRNINTAALNAALASSDPNTAFNPYGIGPATNPVVLAGIRDWVLERNNRNGMESYSVQLDGPLFRLPAGDLKVAVGAEERRENYYEFNPTGASGTRVGAPPVDTTRSITSYFAEAIVPVFSEENAIPLVESLNLSLAVRTEDYSTLGRTTNPKFGFTWMTGGDFGVRGSWGTSFRAPDIRNSIPPPAPNVSFFLTPTTDPTQGGTVVQTVLITGGDPSIRPEEAETFSLGVDWNPDYIPGLRGSLTYFSIDYSNQITRLAAAGNLLTLESIYPDRFTRDPAQIQALINSFSAQGVPATSPLPPLAEIAAFVDGRDFNGGATAVTGFDFDLAYAFDLGDIGEVTAGVFGTYFTDYSVSTVPNTPTVDRLNQRTFPQDLRFRARLGWDNGPYSATLYWNHIAGYTNVGAPRPEIDASNTFDLNLAVQFDGGGPFNIGDQLRLTAEISDLTDEGPPWADLINGFDPEVHSALGRHFSIGLSKAW